MGTCYSSSEWPKQVRRSRNRAKCSEFSEMVDVFKPLIVQNLIVHDILPHLPFIDNHDDIYNEARLHSPKDAVVRLLGELNKSQELRKWQKFMYALNICGYTYIVDNIRGYKFITHEYQKEYLKKLTPKLSKMIEPMELIPHLCSKGLISDTDKENIVQEDNNHGHIAAAVLLMDRITKKHRDWYKQLIDCLVDAGRDDIAANLQISALLKTNRTKETGMCSSNTEANTHSKIENDYTTDPSDNEKNAQTESVEDYCPGTDDTEKKVSEDEIVDDNNSGPTNTEKDTQGKQGDDYCPGTDNTEKKSLEKDIVDNYNSDPSDNERNSQAEPVEDYCPATDNTEKKVSEDDIVDDNKSDPSDNEKNAQAEPVEDYCPATDDTEKKVTEDEIVDDNNSGTTYKEKNTQGKQGDDYCPGTENTEKISFEKEIVDNYNSGPDEMLNKIRAEPVEDYCPDTSSGDPIYQVPPYPKRHLTSLVVDKTLRSKHGDENNITTDEREYESYEFRFPPKLPTRVPLKGRPRYPSPREGISESTNLNVRSENEIVERLNLKIEQDAFDFQSLFDELEFLEIKKDNIHYDIFVLEKKAVLLDQINSGVKRRRGLRQEIELKVKEIRDLETEETETRSGDPIYHVPPYPKRHLTSMVVDKTLRSKHGDKNNKTTDEREYESYEYRFPPKLPPRVPLKGSPTYPSPGKGISESTNLNVTSEYEIVERLNLKIEKDAVDFQSLFDELEQTQ